MVLFAHSSRELAEQSAFLLYVCCYLCIPRKAAELWECGCITGPCVCAGVHEWEGEREAVALQGCSPQEVLHTVVTT